MAQRRMFSKSIIESARFLRMPISSQALYFHLGIKADDDGVVEAYTVMRMTGSTEDDLRILSAKDLIIVLNDDLVSYITDWKEHNKIRADRKIDSIYKDLLVRVLPDVELVKKKQRADIKQVDNQRTTNGQPMDGIGKDRLGKDRLGKVSSSKEVVSDNCDNVTPNKDIVTHKSRVGHADADSMFMNDVPNLIGSESDSAKRVRRHRQIKKEEQKALQCNADVTSSNTEIDIELKKELYIEQQQQKEISDAPAADPISKINAHEFYQNNFQVAESPFIAQSIEYWIEDLSEELVIEAMKRALISEKGYKYAEGILKNWDKKNIKSMDEVKAEDVSFENSKNKSVANNGNSKPTSSEYDGFF